QRQHPGAGGPSPTQLRLRLGMISTDSPGVAGVQGGNTMPSWSNKIGGHSVEGFLARLERGLVEDFPQDGPRTFRMAGKKYKRAQLIALIRRELELHEDVRRKTRELRYAVK